MPVKLKDFLQKTFEQGDVRGDEIAAVLGASALAEIEIPDIAVQKFNESYLTRSKAENDPEIIKKIKLSSKAEILDTVDKEIAKLYPLIDGAKVAEIEKNQNTFKKLELLNEAIGEAIKNGKTNVDKTVQKIDSDWAEKIKQKEAEYQQQLEALKKKAEDDKKDFALRSKLLTFELAESFSVPGIKGPLIETIISNIKQTKVKDNLLFLELDATGSLNVRQNIEGALRDVYPDGSNEKLTIEKLIAPHIEPFIKKSQGKGNEKNPDGKQVTQPIDPKSATLRDLQWAEASR